MQLDWVSIAVLALAYLFGSIPGGVLVARLYRVDLRRVGSGNIGATNVQRALGWGPAIFVAFFDIFKGGIAVWIARFAGVEGWLLGGVAVAAVLGHNFPITLRFSGGKGVATSLGTLLFLDPEVALYSALIGLAVILFTRYVSAGSLTGAVAAVVLALALARPDWELVTLALMAAMLFFTHRENLRRLWRGEERRLGERVRPDGERARPAEHRGGAG